MIESIKDIFIEKHAREIIESSRTLQAIKFRPELGYDQRDIRHQKKNQCEEKCEKESISSKLMKIFSNE